MIASATTVPLLTVPLLTVPCTHHVIFPSPPPPHLHLLAGAGFLGMLKGFRKGLPEIRPITLTASVLFYVPGVRDLSCWLGFRQVGLAACIAPDASSLSGGKHTLPWSHACHATTTTCLCF